MKEKKYGTREQWLEAAAGELRRLAKQLGGFDIPKVRVSVGFPKSRGKDVRGECHRTLSAHDGVNQIFIHPLVDRPITVLAILLHELIHASDDGESNHRGTFVERMKAMGMVKPWISSTTGVELELTLGQIAKELGDWPHSALGESHKEPKKQTTRMIKVSCVSEGHDEYIVRMTRKQMEAVGTPLCPMHSHQMEADLPDDAEDDDA